MKEIGKNFLDWYTINKRKLPWRETKDPYLIWISEIILQQTRIDQGLDYYLKFVKRFPNVKALAIADEEEILKYWQGLGYYSRARNLHFSAKYIYKNLNGVFPNTYEGIKKLKGVGPYTAAAIASISFDLPYPVVDGNVLRVISRLFGIKEAVNTTKGHNKVEKKVNSIFIKEKAADFNQAMMEFGALYCKPQNPNCTNCIFKKYCKSYKSNIVNQIPYKEKARKPVDLFLYYFVYIDNNNELFIRKRNDKGIWKNMYEFPCIESNSKQSLKKIINSTEVKKWINTDYLNNYTEVKLKKHQLSHKSVYAHFIIFFEKDNNLNIEENKFTRVKLNKLKTLPVSKLIENFINHHLNQIIIH